jgi:PhnB protein
MANIVAYINFADRGREQLDFYKSVFGGDYKLTLVKDSQMASQMNPEWAERIMHADFTAGDLHLMGSDIISDQAGLERGNGYSLALMCESVDQVKDYFAKLAEGGKEVWAPTDSEWGGVFGQCVDKYGVQWMLEYDKPKS